LLSPLSGTVELFDHERADAPEPCEKHQLGQDLEYFWMDSYCDSLSPDDKYHRSDEG